MEGPLIRGGVSAPLRDPVKNSLRLAPWVPAIAAGAAAATLDPFLLAAICLRETWAGWAPGYSKPGCADGWGDDPDGAGGKPAHGFGLFQIDRRYHAAFINSHDAADPKAQAMYAAILLDDERERFRRHLPRRMPAVHLRLAIAAYNAGFGRVFDAVSRGSDPDSVTTGKDYSEDVLERMRALVLEAPALFNPSQKESDPC